MFYHLSARPLFVCAFFVLLAYMVTGLVCAPIVQSDAMVGFLSLNNALLGKGDNYQYQVTAAGIIQKKVYAWHAPGQYVIPYILGRPFNSIGYGILLTEAIALLAGSVLYIRLLRRFHIPEVVIALSMLLLFVQRFFHGVVLVYKTADVWLFFLVPALLLSLVSYHTGRLRGVAACVCLLSIVLVHALGLFVKNSYVVFAGFALLFFFLAMLWRQANAHGFSLGQMLYHAVPGIVFSMMLAGAYAGFYSRGDTPMLPLNQSVQPGVRMANILFYPAITVLNAPFSFNGLLYRLPFVSMSELYNGAFSAKALVVGGLMICPVFLLLYKVWLDKQFSLSWKFLAFAVVAFYSGVWAYFVYTGADVSNEERLILPATIIVMPLLVYAAFKTRVGAIAVGCYFLLSITFSGFALLSLKLQYEGASMVTRTDMFHHFRISQGNQSRRELAALKEVLRGDRRDALLVVRTPENFFRTGVQMPAMASGFDHYRDIEKIAITNHRFFVSEGYRHVYFLVPVARYSPKMTARLRLVETKMHSYKLLCYDL